MCIDEHDRDLEEYLFRTTNNEHSPDCNCSICQADEDMDIGIGGIF